MLIVAHLPQANASPEATASTLNGKWQCARTILQVDADSARAGGFVLHIQDDQWRTQTEIEDGTISYFGTATVLDDAISTVFSNYEIEGTGDQSSHKDRAERTVPTTVNYVLSDIAENGFRLTTERTQLDCSALIEETL